MRLDKELQLAINILAKLSSNPKSSAELAGELGASVVQVQKVSCKLCRLNLCGSLRGFGGGFYKERHVNALEVVHAMQLQRKAVGRSAEVQDQLEFALENIWI